MRKYHHRSFVWHAEHSCVTTSCEGGGISLINDMGKGLINQRINETPLILPRWDMLLSRYVSISLLRIHLKTNGWIFNSPPCARVKVMSEDHTPFSLEVGNGSGESVGVVVPRVGLGREWIRQFFFSFRWVGLVHEVWNKWRIQIFEEGGGANSVSAPSSFIIDSAQKQLSRVLRKSFVYGKGSFLKKKKLWANWVGRSPPLSPLDCATVWNDRLIC